MSSPLKEYRDERKWSQGTLAKRLRISRQMVGLLESGSRKFTAEMCLRIESRLGIPREVLRADLFRKAA